MAPIILLSFFLLGNDPERNCKHLQTDTWVRVFINTNHAKLKQLRLAYWNTYKKLIIVKQIIVFIVLPKTLQW